MFHMFIIGMIVMGFPRVFAQLCLVMLASGGRATVGIETNAVRIVRRTQLVKNFSLAVMMIFANGMMMKGFGVLIAMRMDMKKIFVKILFSLVFANGMAVDVWIMVPVLDFLFFLLRSFLFLRPFFSCSSN
jgi:hypothetical protein